MKQKTFEIISPSIIKSFYQMFGNRISLCKYKLIDYGA